MVSGKQKGAKSAELLISDQNDKEREKRTSSINIYEPGFFKLPIAERSKLLRAQRNREAAHRSRAKNKIRQALLEEETRKQLQLCIELESLADFLLPILDRTSRERLEC